MPAVATPPNIAAAQEGCFSKLNVSNKRVKNCIKAPTVKAITTESKIPRMISMALSELIYSPI